MAMTFNKLLTYLCLLINLTGFAQADSRIDILFSQQEISEGESFAIAADLYNVKPSNPLNFPNLPGFKKGQIDQRSQYVNNNGRSTQAIRFTQYYQSNKPGVFKVPSFTLETGGVSTSHNGLTITVKENPYLKDDSFLSIVPSKTSVYLGEPFKVSVCFYYAKNDQRTIGHQRDLNEQLNEIREKLRLPTAWAEEIEKPDRELKEIELNAKTYYKETLYEIVLIPQTIKDLYFPSVALKMVKAVPSGRDSWGRTSYQNLSKSYPSQPVNVRVKDHPAHPLKGKVPVGVYRLEEGVDRLTLHTGENIVYSFSVSGSGNLPTLQDPILEQTDSLLVLKESDKLNYSNRTGVIAGKKVFLFNIVPQIPGEYPIKNYISFPYFNYQTGQYERLESELVIQASGQSILDQRIEANNATTTLSNTPKGTRSEINDRLVSIDDPEKQNLITNLLLLLLIAGVGFLIYRGKGESA